MKKKLIALFAACSMITTAVAGLVQTAYADDDPISIVVSDGATDTEKVLTFYYNTDGINLFEGTLTLDNGATIDSADVTIPMLSGNNSDKEARPEDGYFMCLTYTTTPLSSEDHSFAKATVTVPGDVDVTVSFEFTLLERDDNDRSATVTATIPKKAASEPEEPEEPEKTYYDKGYAFTSSADTVAKTYTKLTINVIDKANENKPGYAEVDLKDKLPTISGSGEFTLFIKNIPAAYDVTSVELD